MFSSSIGLIKKKNKPDFLFKFSPCNKWQKQIFFFVTSEIYWYPSKSTWWIPKGINCFEQWFKYRSFILVGFSWVWVLFPIKIHVYVYIHIPVCRKKICIPVEVHKEDRSNIIVVIIFTRRHNDIFIQYLR